MIAVQEILRVNIKEAENCSSVICFTVEAWNLALRRLVWTGLVSHMRENKSSYRVFVVEALYMPIWHKHDILIAEQQVIDKNPLYDLARTTRDLQSIL